MPEYIIIVNTPDKTFTDKSAMKEFNAKAAKRIQKAIKKAKLSDEVSIFKELQSVGAILTECSEKVADFVKKHPDVKAVEKNSTKHAL